MFNGVGTFYYPAYHLKKNELIEVESPNLRSRVYYKGNFVNDEFSGFGIMYFDDNS